MIILILEWTPLRAENALRAAGDCRMGSMLDGRVIAVTGAGRGTGRAIALVCGRPGSGVVINDLGASVGGEGADASPAEEVVSLIRAAGGKAIVNGASVA